MHFDSNTKKDDQPSATLQFTYRTSNDVLSEFSPDLKSSLYRRPSEGLRQRDQRGPGANLYRRMHEVHMTTPTQAAQGNAWNCWPCWPRICRCGDPKTLEECQDGQGLGDADVGGLRDMRESPAHARSTA